MPQVLQAGARYLAALDYARRGLLVVPLHYAVRDRRTTAVACSCGEPACARVGAHRCPPTGRRRHHRPHPAHLVVAALDANVGLATDQLRRPDRARLGRRRRPLVGGRPGLRRPARWCGPAATPGTSSSPWRAWPAPVGAGQGRVAGLGWLGGGPCPATTPAAPWPPGCATSPRCPTCHRPSPSGWSRSARPSLSPTSTPKLASRYSVRGHTRVRFIPLQPEDPATKANDRRSA